LSFKAWEVDKQAHKEEPILAGKDFGPIVGDFGHMASEATPIIDYLNQREDSDLEYLETIQAQLADRKCMG